MLTPDPEVTPEMLALARRKVIQARAQQLSDEDIDAYLKSEIGLGLKEVMSPNMRDYLRAAGMGASLGFEDELAGLGAALMPGGKSYTQARDEVRENYAAAHKVAPKRMIAAEIAGGLAPALATLGVGAPATGLGAGARALQAMKVAGGIGTVAGVGHSNAATPVGVAEDAAVSGGASALLGGATSVAGTAVSGVVKKALDALHPERVVTREAATQVPAGVAANITRQEQLAPGTGILADQSPELTAMTRGVGADAEAGVNARLAAEARLKALKDAKAALGPRYDALEQQLPVDDELRAIMARANESIPGDEVAFARLQQLRTALLEGIRATKKGSRKFEDGKIVSDLTKWLQARIPDLKQVDSDWNFLTKRVAAATKLGKEVASSSSNYAANRTYGGESGSIGGSLPASTRGVTELLTGLFKPDRAVRARTVANMLLTPGDATQTALSSILKARQAMSVEPNLLSRMGPAGLFGDLIPQVGAQMPGLLYKH